MKDRLLITFNEKEKTLSLVLPSYNTPEGDIIGPYFAMYKYIYEDYTWTNWFDWYKENINLENLRNGTMKHRFETYINSVILDTDYIDEDVIFNIADELGGMPNYFYLVERGRVELINAKNVDYKCGEGFYFYDRENFEDKIKPDLIYEGEYLRCILDTRNNIKSGQVNPEEEEILIPFHIKF